MRRPLHLCFLAAAVVLGCAVSTTCFAADKNASFGDRLQNIWNKGGKNALPADIASSNGRVEAEHVLVAAKFAGRVAQVLAEEGQTVEAGSVIARMDASDLQAQLAGAQAQVRRAEKTIAEAEAALTQRDSELVLAHQELDRASTLATRGYGTAQQLDLRRSQLNVAEAAKRAASASLDEANAGADAARAEVARVSSLVDDAVLTAPRRGRVEYKLVQSGEVVAAGAPVVTLLDLSDVYMTVFLPSRAAGRLALADDARIILDAAPDYVVPATVSFVATDAQFTPKTVETADEREKLMFRVKLKIAPNLLKRYEARVKTGVRGVAYVRTLQTASWPAWLQVKLPQ